MSLPATPWEERSAQEKQDAVLPLILAGKAYSEIADLLGAPSRNSIASIATYLRKAGRLPPVKPRAARRPARAQPQLRLTKFQAKASEDNGATVPGPAVESPADCMAGEASRSRSGDECRPATSERMDATVVGDESVTLTISRAAAWDPLPGVEPIGILDLTATTCRWPLWDYPDDPRLYCGCPCEVTETYCAAHRRLVPSAYQPARKVA